MNNQSNPSYTHITLATLAFLGCLPAVAAPSFTTIALAAYSLFSFTLLGTLVAAASFWKTGNPIVRLTIWGSHLFWYGAGALTLAAPPVKLPPFYPHFISLGKIPNDVLAMSSFCVGLYFATLVIAFELQLPVSKKFIGLFSRRYDKKPNISCDFTLLLCSGLALSVLFITYGFSFTTLIHNFSQLRYGEKISATYNIGIIGHVYHLSFFAAAASLTRLIKRIPGSYTFRTLSFVQMLVIAFATNGTRYLVGYIFLPPLFAMATQSSTVELNPDFRNYWWKRRRTLLLIVTVLMVQTISLQGIVRNSGIQGLLSVDNYLNSAGLVGSNQFPALAVAIDITQQRGGPYYESHVLNLALHFIPRQIWPSKPVPQTYVDYNQLWTQGHSFNVTPSIVGQYYMSLGVLGPIVGGLVMAFIARTSDAIYKTLDFQFQSLGLTYAGLILAFYVFSQRYFYGTYLAYVVFGFAVYWLTTTTRKPLSPTFLTRSPPPQQNLWVLSGSGSLPRV